MVYLSRHLQDLYRRRLGTGIQEGGQVVYTAIDEDTHRVASDRRLDQERQPGLILSVSVMAPWKGIHVVIKALALLHRRGCRARLRLVGPWPDRLYEASIRQLICLTDLEDYVTIVGKVSKGDLYRHYAQAQVFCVMSKCESFGIPAVEAQVFGTPVVGSSACAMPEVCGPGGLFGPPDDAEGTADLLGRMLEDRGEWEKLSRHARKNASRYRWKACSRPLLAILRLSGTNGSINPIEDPTCVP